MAGGPPLDSEAMEQIRLNSASQHQSGRSRARGTHAAVQLKRDAVAARLGEGFLRANPPGPHPQASVKTNTPNTQAAGDVEDGLQKLNRQDLLAPRYDPSPPHKAAGASEKR